MKFLKRSQLNSRNVADNSVAVEITGEVKLDTTYAALIPNGTTAQRPTTASTNGQIRYNNQTNEFEFRQNNEWRRVAFKEPTTITAQPIGTGDETEIYFGPLVSGFTTIGGDPLVPDLDKPQNIMVYIENVYQLPLTNYSLEDLAFGDPALNGRLPGRYVKFDSAVPFGKDVTVLHGFDR
jgi:hypothetical protein